MIVSPEPSAGSPPATHRIGQCGSHFPVVRSPVSSVGGSASSAAQFATTTCVQCQPNRPAQQEQHHYHEIGQTPLTNQLNGNLAMNPTTCCCGGTTLAGGGAAAYCNQPPRQRHQYNLPGSDSGSLQGRRRLREANRNCRGNILTSSTENLQSGCESHCGRKKKRWVF